MQNGKGLDIREIKERVRLEEVVARYVELRSRGNYLTGRCPFHQDGGRPNFVVYKESQSYICFVCGAKGDVIDFLVQKEGITKSEAIHQLSGQVAATPVSRSPVILSDHQDSGDVVVRDGAYRALLSLLDLSTTHEESLLARGLSPAAIAANAYRTLPKEGIGAVVDALVERGVDLTGVPGFAISRRSNRWWLYGPPGILVPVRGVRGRIIGMQVRVDGGRSKYVWLSTPDSDTRYGGSSSGAPCHVAGREFVRRKGVVWVTEGPLKADVASYFLRAPVLGVAGVTSWRKMLPIAQALEPERVLLAFDQDEQVETRQAVERNLTAARVRMQHAGIHVLTATWKQGKGIDDALKLGQYIAVS